SSAVPGLRGCCGVRASARQATALRSSTTTYLVSVLARTANSRWYATGRTTNNGHARAYGSNPSVPECHSSPQHDRALVRGVPNPRSSDRTTRLHSRAINCATVSSRAWSSGSSVLLPRSSSTQIADVLATRETGWSENGCSVVRLVERLQDHVTFE